MKIELRNFKYAKFASEETNCFEATVFVDGVKAGEARNEGHGGATMIFPRELEARINAYAATLPPIVSSNDDLRDDDGEPFSYAQTAETLVDDVVTELLIAKDFRRLVARRILYTKADTPGIFQTKAAKDAATLAHWLRDPVALAARFGAAHILNTMPEAEALAIFKAQA